MLFVDSNIPMYLVGSDANWKRRAQELLERSIGADERLVASAEVFREILHRYVAIRRRDAIEPASRMLLDVVDEVFPIEVADVLRAGEIVQAEKLLSARDALHLAVMERHQIDRVLSFDSGFDHWPGVVRVSS